MESENYISREYVLQVLGRWNADRVRKNLTQADVEHAVNYILGDLERKTQLDETEREELKKEATATYTLDYIARILETGFTNGYSFWEAIYENQEIDGERLSDIPEGVRNEYFEPALEQFRKLKSFVDLTRNYAKRCFPDELDYKTIDDAFIDIFENSDNFSAVGLKFCEGIEMIMNLDVIQGKIKQSTFAEFHNAMSIAKQFTPIWNRKIFMDLDGRKP